MGLGKTVQCAAMIGSCALWQGCVAWQPEPVCCACCAAGSPCSAPGASCLGSHGGSCSSRPANCGCSAHALNLLSPAPASCYRTLPYTHTLSLLQDTCPRCSRLRAPSSSWCPCRQYPTGSGRGLRHTVCGFTIAACGLRCLFRCLPAARCVASMPPPQSMPPLHTCAMDCSHPPTAAIPLPLDAGSSASGSLPSTPLCTWETHSRARWVLPMRQPLLVLHPLSCVAGRSAVEEAALNGRQLPPKHTLL